MMLNLSSAKIADLARGAALACAVTLLLADTASASTRKLSGTHSFGEVASSCGSSGGTFSVNVNGGYRCANGGNVVACDNKGQCYGGCKKCPASVKDVNGILHPPPSAGTATAAAGTTNNNKPPVHNVNQPVVVQRSGHSGGTKH
jgi:hypothetical protein